MRLRQDRATRWQQVPDGYRDLGPAEAERRSALASRLREQFARWGYREVVTPTLEFLETIVHGTGPGIEDQLVKGIDGAAVLALRQAMTVQIARLAAMRRRRCGPGDLRDCFVRCRSCTASTDLSARGSSRPRRPAAARCASSRAWQNSCAPTASPMPSRSI